MYKLCSDLIEVKEITNYKGDKPTFGDLIGIYHPFLANVFILTEEELKIYKKLQKGLKNHNEVPHSFKDNFMVLNGDEKLELNFPSEIDNAEAYIKLTEGCNFSCEGCATASDKIHPSKAKTLNINELSYLLTNFVRSCYEKEIKNVKIKWAGGEPLLGNSYGLITAAQPILKELAEKYKVTIKQSLLTNGVFLTKDKMNFAKDNEIHIAVSLWGTKKYQNLTRKPRTKNDSYEAIINNIKYLIENKNSFNINYIISPLNAIDFPDFLDSVWNTASDTFIGSDYPLRLSINVYRPTGVTDNVLEAYYKSVEKGVRRGFNKIYSLLGAGINLPSLGRFDYLDLFSIRQSACGTTKNYVALGPEGVSACHESLFEMKDNFAKLKDVNILDLAKTTWESENGDSETLSANNISHKYLPFLKYQGASGCPRLAKSVHKKTGETSPTEKLYSNIYYELLCLETMRMLKN